MNHYGDPFLVKEVDHFNAYRIGEENVILGISNPFTIISRGWLVALVLDTGAFFKLIHDTGVQTIQTMKKVTAQKLKSVTQKLGRKIKAEVLVEDLGYLKKNQQIIFEQERDSHARECINVVLDNLGVEHFQVLDLSEH